MAEFLKKDPIMTGKVNILAIDDDLTLIELLGDFFTRNNCDFIHFGEPDPALGYLSHHKPDLIILDVMLPGGSDGFTICQKIKKSYSIPIIMLSARGDVNDRIRGLEMGADDYLPKPFNPQELLVRARKLMSRTPTIDSSNSQLIKFDQLELDPIKRAVKVDGHPVSLSGSEYEVLHLFMTKPGDIITRDDISQAVAGQEYNAFSRSVDAIISRLRFRLKDPARAPRFLSTIWGRGYVFIGKSKA
jgi:two-component system, OmpR family, response regulator